MKYNVVLALVLVFALALTGCGASKEVQQTDAAPVQTLAPDTPLELVSWRMNATAWSSPNGATVNLIATPNGYAEGQTVVFSVRLEGEEVASVPCSWDGSVYTASADLNAADGYCYFALLTGADGTQTEVAVNTPTAMIDDSLIHMQSSLLSYCEVTVESSTVADGKLTVEKGTVKIQLPRLTLDQGPLSCQKAVLKLRADGEDVSQTELTVSEPNENNACFMDISGMEFDLPENIQGEQRLGLTVDATLSNGHTLTAPGAVWHLMDGDLKMGVG